MKKLSLLLTIVSGLACAEAHAAVFKHVDGVTHVVSYTNFRPRDYPARELVLAAPRQVAPKRTAPAAVLPSKLALLPPAGFPHVDHALQRERDVDRKKILNDELHAEQGALAQALARSAASDIVGRHRSNVAALLREVARLK